MPQSFADWRAAGYVGGSPMQIVEQLAEFERAGASRLMLAHYPPADLESLEMLTRDVLPQFKTE